MIDGARLGENYDGKGALVGRCDGAIEAGYWEQDWLSRSDGDGS